MVDVLTGFSLLAAAAIAGASMPGGSGATPPDNAPLLLKVDSSGEAVVIRLVGDSAVTCAVRYELEVSGANGGNHSVNRGTATIRPGPPVTVATVRVGNRDQHDVSARLRVSSCGGKDYADEWHWTKPPHA
jgi:hypothetical protein